MANSRKVENAVVISRMGELIASAAATPSMMKEMRLELCMMKMAIRRFVWVGINKQDFTRTHQMRYHA